MILLQVAIDGLLLGGVYGLMSMGVTLIFGVMGIIQFAHGEYLMLSMYSTFWIFQLLGIDPYLSLIVVVPLFFLIGVMTQRGLIDHILNAPEMAQIFATVGVSIVLKNLAVFLWSADYRAVPTSYASINFNLGRIIINFPKIMAFFISLGLSIVIFIFLKRTFLGKAIRATSQNRKAAQLMGINIHRIYLFVLGIGTAMVGVAGAVLMPMYWAFPTVGTYFVIIAFVVVVLGGMGNVMGAFFGGLLIGLVESFSGLFLPPTLKGVIYYFIFLIILIFKPSGLFRGT
jgi:branched-chain amino acid transport system permease protein